MTTQSNIENIAAVVNAINFGLDQITTHLNAPTHSIEVVHATPSGLRFTFEVKAEGSPFKIHSIIEVLKSYMENGETGFPLLNEGRISYVNETGNTFHFWFA